MKNPLAKNSLWLTLAVTLAACGASQPAPSIVTQPATQPQPLNKSVQDNGTALTPSSWFVQLSGQPTTSGISAQSVLSAQSAFRALAQKSGISYQEKYAYTSLFNGFSVKASSSEIARISKLPGVVAIYPVERATLPKMERITSPVGEPQLASAITQTGVNIAQNELKLSGKGIKVGVVDSGIDVDHPAFKNRIVAQYDFVGDDYGVKDSYIPKPDDNADDCDGHGTHVAGIVGGKDGEIRGVAPEVSFGAYRVFGCDGGTDYDVWVAAMERAAADGMDIVTMSIGSFGGLPGNPVYQAIENLNKQGIFVVKSGGNNGDRGLFAVDGTGAAPGALTVASFENISNRNGVLKVLPDNLEMLAAPAQPLKAEVVTLMATGTPSTANDACNTRPLAANSLAGKWALVRRGTCTFQEKLDNVKKAGAVGFFVYNRADGGAPFAPSATGLPSLMVSYADGVKLHNRLGSGEVKVQLTPEIRLVSSATGDLLSGFSSFGPTADLKFKPDLGAPGGSIYSSYPLELGGYSVLSGTSMAAPHIAGILALMLEKNPSLTFDEARTRLQNTATPQLWSADTSLGLLDTTQRQGAGMANVVKAIETPVTVSPSSLALGETLVGGFTQTLTLKNTSNQPVIYALSHEDVINSTNPVSAAPSYGETEVTFSAASVTVPAGGSATVGVTIVAPPDQFSNGTMYGGYLNFASEQATLRVPYMGFQGDYQAVKGLTQGALFYVDEKNNLYRQPANALFVLEDGDLPTIGWNQAYPMQRLEVDLLDGNTLLPVFRNANNIITFPGVGRNTSATVFNTFTWDGSFKNAQLENGLPVTKTVGNGRYAFRIRALKMLGQESNPAHWETFISVPFFILKPNP